MLKVKPEYLSKHGKRQFVILTIEDFDRIKEALADAHVDLALEKAFLEVACEELNQPLEVFKKKHAGGRRTERSRPVLNSRSFGSVSGRK